MFRFLFLLDVYWIMPLFVYEHIFWISTIEHKDRPNEQLYYTSEIEFLFIKSWVAPVRWFAIQKIKKKHWIPPNEADYIKTLKHE